MKKLQSSRKDLKVALHPSLEVSKITSFISRKVKDANSAGIVIGLSGGVDSSVVAALCVKAIGRTKVTGIFLFEDAKSKDYRDAKKLASQLGVKTFEVNISPIASSVERSLSPILNNFSRLTLGNIKARARMIVLYSVANQKGLLVAGTGDKSEELLGYFTKFGDGAADIMPIAHLYKSEVRALGTHLRLPLDIVTKPSTPNLWKGQMATDELPASYEVLDPVLTLLFDEKKTANETAKLTGVPLEIVKKVLKLHSSSKHKRELPFTFEEQTT